MKGYSLVEDEETPKRSSSLTILETLNNFQIWVFILLPLLLCLSTSFLPMNSEHTDMFSANSTCPTHFSNCYSTGHSLTIETGPIRPLEYLRVSLSIPTEVILRNSSDIHVVADSYIYYKTNSHPIFHSTTYMKHYVLLFANTTLPKEMVTIPLAFTGLFNPFEANSYEDRPVLVKVIISRDSVRKKHEFYELLKSSTLVVSTKNPSFTVVHAILTLIFTAIIIRIIIFSLQRHWSHRVAGTSILLGLYCEQIYTMLLAVFLVLWLDPITSFMIVGVSFSKGYLSDRVDGISEIVRAFAFEGILFCLFVLVDGLRLVDRGLDEFVEALLGSNSPTRRPNTNANSTPTNEDWWRTDSSQSSPRKESDNSRWWVNTQGTNVEGSGYYQGSGGGHDAAVNQHGRRRSSLGYQANRATNHSSSTPHSPSPTRTLTVYHPLSPLFVDAMGRNLFFLFVTWVVTFGYWTLQFPHSLGYANPNEEEKPKWNIFCSVLYIAYLGCVWGWIFKVLIALSNSKWELRKISYLRSRFRQILCQLLDIQLWIAIGLTSASIAIQTYQVAQNYNLSWATFTAHTSDRDWGHFCLVLIQFALGSWLNENGARTGIVTFLSTVICLVVIAMSPAKTTTNPSPSGLESSEQSDSAGFRQSEDLRSVEILTTHSFYTLEKHIPSNNRPPPPPASTSPYVYRPERQQGMLRDIMSQLSPFKNTNRELFCLETACRLLEVSYQTYFSGSGHLTRSVRIKSTRTSAATASNTTEKPSDLRPASESYGPALDLTRLGYQLHSVFENVQSATFGVVGLAEFEIVIGFRGSVYENIYTDMKFGTIPLPELKTTRSYFIDLLLNNSNSSTTPGSGRKSSDFKKLSVDSCDDHEVYRKVVEMLRTDSTSKQHSPKPVQVDEPFSSSTQPTENDSGGQDSILLNPSYQNYTPPPAIATDVPNETSLLNVTNVTAVPTPEETSGPANCWKSIVKSIPLVNNALPRVHLGFWEAYSSIRKDVLLAVILALQAAQRTARNHVDNILHDIVPPIKLHFCGHSLGGALAQLAALDISINLTAILRAIRVFDENQRNSHKLVAGSAPHISTILPTPEVVTYVYGSPRVGNSVFAHLCNRLCKVTYRVEMEGDLITMIPPVLALYKHAGVNVVVDSNGVGSLIVQPTIVESRLIRRSAISAHQHKLDAYRHCLEACFSEEEYQEYLENETKFWSI